MILALSATSGSAQHLRVSSLKRWLPPRGERLRAGEGPQRPPVSPPPSADRGPAPRRGCDSATVTRSHGHRAGGRLRGTALRRWPAGGSFSRFSRLPLGRCQGVSTLACVGPRPPASGAGAALSHAEESEAIPEPKRGGRVSCRPRWCTAQARLPSRVQAPRSRGAQKECHSPSRQPWEQAAMARLSDPAARRARASGRSAGPSPAARSLAEASPRKAGSPRGLLTPFSFLK